MNGLSANLSKGRIFVNKWMKSILAESRYLSMVTVVFLVSAISGFVNGDALLQVVKKWGLMEQIERIIQSIAANPSFLYAFWRIFLNNVLASLTMMTLGLFFGFAPFFAMVTNGMVLGMTLKLAEKATGEHPLWIFATTILPHGILEIPAVLLSAAFGVHLGLAVLRRLGSVFFPSQVEKSKMEWQGIMRRLPYVLAMVIVLLVFAALVEAGLIIYAKPLT